MILLVMEKLKFWLRSLVRKSVAIHSLTLLLRGRKTVYSLLRTDIVIEGFPRSGNTFFVRLVMALHQDLRVGSHFHSISSLKFCVDRKIPCVVLIREPIESLSSLIIKKRQYLHRNDLATSVHSFIVDYIEFYEYAVRYKIPIMSFQIVTRNPKISIPIVQSVISKQEFVVIDEATISSAAISVKNELDLERIGSLNANSSNRAKEDAKKLTHNLIRGDADFDRAQSLYDSIVNSFGFDD